MQAVSALAQRWVRQSSMPNADQILQGDGGRNHMASATNTHPCLNGRTATDWMQTQCQRHWFPSGYLLFREERLVSRLSPTPMSKLMSLFTTKTAHTCFALLRCCTLHIGRTPATSLHRQLLEPAWTFPLGKSVLLSWKFAKNQYFVSRWRPRRDLESYCYVLPQSQSLCSPCSLCGLQPDRALGYKGLRTLTA